MDDPVETLKKALLGQRARQAGTLYAALAFTLLVGLAASMINTRYLGKDGYGDFCFVQSLFSFASTFATLGVFVTGSRLLAREPDPAGRRELAGALLLFGALGSAGMTAALFGFSFFSERLFHNGLASTIRAFSPLAFVFPLQLGVGALLQGENRIYRLSLLRALPLGLYLPAVLVYTRFADLTLHAALGFRCAVLAALILTLSWTLHPAFRRLGSTLRGIWRENLQHGVHVYGGDIAAVATSQLGALLIAHFVDSSALGLYGLALTVSNPLLMIAATVGTTFFRQFASSSRIPRSVLLVTVLASAAALAGFLLVIRFFIEVFYPPAFAAAVPLAHMLATAATLSGLAAFIGRFLDANGQGRSLRNISVVIGAANLVGYFVLVRRFGAWGAAATGVAVGSIHLSLSCLIYRTFVSRKADPGPPILPGAA